MDIQIVLVFILALLTINLIVVGVYLILVLKEFRETIKKTNSVLDNVQSLSNVVSNPLTLLTGFMSAVVQGYNAVKSINTIRGDRKKE
ncbi:hypothetical protein A3H26_01290 [candidate division WWE3 bacterium RIFCSPLOWO2_12_FULL_36_10]|uniref:DUF948 domain-containing protein n=1 Tax=candidate division WWE3 bacterium RIFCSPLOWO2_12_FULL_36_10 TaxID=1802630 RepID=A0A1F4VJV5_UNCKA|nr:MAG: hypothetical protein A3H26_01290 [candidate division WWE3 bacterium RIFCSPLOWO2_12_FULL_36_10]